MRRPNTVSRTEFAHHDCFVVKVYNIYEYFIVFKRGIIAKNLDTSIGNFFSFLPHPSLYFLKLLL